VTILFYRREAESSPLSGSIDVRAWRPAREGFPPSGPFRARNVAWWSADRLRLFSNRDFAEITIRREHKLVHRLILTPRWYRFPFMASEDLQIGDVWTAPHARGQGLAKMAIAQALTRAGQGRCVWYVVDAGNHPSVRLIERCGFALVGRGKRSRPFGLRIAGRFML
jgi:RimJ/RimL family protein N-acetyltransferase